MSQQPGSSNVERSAPPQRADFRFWTQEKVRNADTDQFRHVNNAVISTFLEAARMEIFTPSEVNALMGGANLAVVRLVIDFRSEIHFPASVSIGSNVIAVGRTSLQFSQGLFVNTGDSCSVSAQATCVLVHPATGRPHPIDPDLRRCLLAVAGEGVGP